MKVIKSISLFKVYRKHFTTFSALKLSVKKASVEFLCYCKENFDFEGCFSWPTTAQRCRSETEKITSEDLFSSVLVTIKTIYNPFGNMKFNNLGNFWTLKISYFNGKKLPISLKINFTPNTLGCYGLMFRWWMSFGVKVRAVLGSII